MTHSLRLVLVFHNHQPVGNFDGVFEQAYQDSYRPFLDVVRAVSGAADRAPHERLADGVAGGAASRSTSSGWPCWLRPAASRSSAGRFTNRS